METNPSLTNRLIGMGTKKENKGKGKKKKRKEKRDHFSVSAFYRWFFFSFFHLCKYACIYLLSSLSGCISFSLFLCSLAHALVLEVCLLYVRSNLKKNTCFCNSFLYDK